MSLVSNNAAEDIAPIFGDPDFGISDAAIEMAKAESKSITEVNDNKSLKVAQAAVTNLVTLRTSIDAKRKDLKAPALEYGRAVEAKAKSLIALLEPEETRLKGLVKAEKDRKESIKREAEAKEKIRTDAIEARIEEIRDIPLAMAAATSEEIARGILSLDSIELSEEAFEEYLSQATMVHAKVSAAMGDLFQAATVREAADAAAKIERERVEKEEAEAKAAQDAEREKAEAEQRAEAQRVAEEQAKVQAEQEAAAKKIAEEQAQVRAEREAIEEQKRAEAEEARLKAEAEAAAAEAERLKPQRERLAAYLDSLLAVDRPELEDATAQSMVDHIVNSITATKEALL